jgi:hypothetical protein
VWHWRYKQEKNVRERNRERERKKEDQAGRQGIVYCLEVAVLSERRRKTKAQERDKKEKENGTWSGTATTQKLRKWQHAEQAASHTEKKNEEDNEGALFIATRKKHIKALLFEGG